ncbi:MAG: hypothetical protein ABI041_15965 [Bdellovibrionia bacterium]
MGSPGKLILISIFLFPLVSQGQGESGNKTVPLAENKISLSTRERDSLRYHLENLYNEVDLLIRNQRVNYFDLQKQERDLVTLKVFERIPFDHEPITLRESLRKSALESGIIITYFEYLPISQITLSLPRFVYTNSSFHLREDQLVEKIKFVMRVEGPNVRKWTESLPQTLMRYIKVDRVEPVGKSWRVIAHAFRFRIIQFPQLKPKEPLSYLPTWAQKNPTQFAQAEPTLWTFVKRIENLTPKTPLLYVTRGKFFLNDARLNFFLRLTKQL